MARWTVIIAGGVGARFWPLSTAARPKQLLSFDASGQSLLQQTVARSHKLTPYERIVIVTSETIADRVRADVPEVAHVLAEPCGRNTAPCIAWAMAHISALDKNASLAVLPADHRIDDEEAFVATLGRAFEVAEADTQAIVTVGITPTAPETGFGYIKAGAAGAHAVCKVDAFVEKPDLATAEAYLASGNYFWNAGMFVFSEKAMRAEMKRQMPELYALLTELADAYESGAGEEKAVARYPALKKESIDYGVMEHANNILVIPARFSWSDLGSFQSAWQLGKKDENGNIQYGKCALVDARNCYVRAHTASSNDLPVAVVGLEDVVVVLTDNGLLVCHRDHSQRVKEATAMLSED